MTRRFALSAALLLTTGLLAPDTALLAQRRVLVGVAGGASMPLGSSGDQLILGWTGLGTLAIQTPVPLLGLRVDAAYNEFNYERALLGGAGPAGALRITSFTLSPTLRLPASGPGASPYVIGGVGAYSIGCTVSTACKSSSKVGWNFGGGATFPVYELRIFLEARYHHTMRNDVSVQYVPVTLGLLF